MTITMMCGGPDAADTVLADAAPGGAAMRRPVQAAHQATTVTYAHRPCPAMVRPPDRDAVELKAGLASISLPGMVLKGRRPVLVHLS
jgi:hypothetical protein